MENINERALRLALSDYSSTYNELLNKTKLTTVHIHPIRQLALKNFKTLHNLNPAFMKDYFIRKSSHHGLFSYSAHLFISIPQDRPVKVIYICLTKIVFNMVQSLFDTLVPNFGIHYPWNSEMLHQKYCSKQN